MSQSSFDAAFSEIQSIYAKWLAGGSASEQALFEIGDVLQTFAEHSPEPAAPNVR